MPIKRFEKKQKGFNIAGIISLNRTIQRELCCKIAVKVMELINK